MAFEPIGTATQRVLADLRSRMERKTGGAKAPGKAARAVRGGEAPALARTRAHRSTPKTTAAYAERAMTSAERE